MPAGDSPERKKVEIAEVDDEDALPDNLFIRAVHCVAWLLTALLSLVSIGFICYQLWALYLPYTLAKATGDKTYRFPEYFYRVWGNDVKDLTSEHWGYLGACATVTFLSIKHVVPEHPFKSRSTTHHKTD